MTMRPTFVYIYIHGHVYVYVYVYVCIYMYLICISLCTYLGFYKSPVRASDSEVHYALHDTL